VRSPYVVGPPVYQPDFYGRLNLVESLLDPRLHCTYLIGGRRTGKTSLLRHLETRSPYVALFFDLQRAAGDPTNLAHELAIEVRRKSRVAPMLGEIHLGPNDDLSDFVFRLAEQAEAKNAQVLMLWDEAEVLLSLDDPIVQRLRSALNHSQSVRTIIAATKRLSGLNDRGRTWTTSPFLQGFAVHYISCLDEDDARCLITQANSPESTMEISEDLCKEIMTLTGNHPYLLQLLCYRLFQPDRTLRPITKQDLVVDEQLANILQIDYDALSQHEQAVLRAVAQIGEAGEQQISRVLDIHSGRLALCLYSLEKLGFLTLSSTGDYHVSNHFLRTWLEMRRGEETSESSVERINRQAAPLPSAVSPHDAVTKLSARHLTIRVDEISRQYEQLTKQIASVDIDIDRATEEFRRQPLKEHRAQLEAERTAIISQLAEIERQLAGIDRVPGT
jgi:hypothetical protein